MSFLPILAFGKAEYTGPDREKSTGAIIASAITGGIGIILLVLEVIAVVALGLFAVSDLTVQQTQDAVISQEVPEETQEEPDVKEEEGVQREYEGTPIEGYEDFETVSLDGYHGLRMSHVQGWGEYSYGVHSNFRKRWN